MGFISNVCFIKNRSKLSSVLLLCLLRIFMKQTLSRYIRIEIRNQKGISSIEVIIYCSSLHSQYSQYFFQLMSFASFGQQSPRSKPHSTVLTGSSQYPFPAQDWYSQLVRLLASFFLQQKVDTLSENKNEWQ